MFGAIIGDIIGSKHEFLGTKTKDFNLLNTEKNFITDDTYMTLAVAKAILESENDFKLLRKKTVYHMQMIGNKFPSAYGKLFRKWLKDKNPKPYGSFGNGAAMRVSPCGMYYTNKDDVIACSIAVTSVTHNHFESLKAAEAVALAVFYLKNGMDKINLTKKMRKYYPLKQTLNEIRKTYIFTEEARNTVPQALQSFLEGKDYIDVVRNAISLGGDADTLACISGALAGVYFGIPLSLFVQLDSYIYEEELLSILQEFEKKIPVKIT